MLEIVTFSLLNGVVYGLLLFMVSSGLTLIFSLMGVLNFAHASMFMLGAYFGFFLLRLFGLPYALVYLLAPVAVGGLAAGTEWLFLRRLRRSDAFSVVMMGRSRYGTE